MSWAPLVATVVAAVIVVGCRYLGANPTSPEIQLDLLSQTVGRRRPIAGQLAETASSERAESGLSELPSQPSPPEVTQNEEHDEDDDYHDDDGLSIHDPPFLM